MVQAQWRTPWGGAAPPGVAFTYAPGRSGQNADDILQGFTGILQGEEGQQTVRGGLLKKSEQHRNVPNILFYLAIKSTSCVASYIFLRFLDFINSPRGTVCPTNGYAGYNRLIQPYRAGPAIRLAYCWAHAHLLWNAHRKLFEVARNSTAPIAEDGLKRIAAFYKIEAGIRCLSSEARLAIRQDQSAPKIAAFETWLTHHRARVSAKSPLGEALKYIAKYWTGHCVQGLTRAHWGHGPLHSSPTVASKWTTTPSSAPSARSP